MRLNTNHPGIPLFQLTAPAAERSTGLKFVGTFNPLREYKKYELVKHDGCTWLCLEPCINSKPHIKSTDKWQRIAARGLAGDGKNAQALLFAQTKKIVRDLVGEEARSIVKKFDDDLSLDGLTRRSATLFQQTMENYMGDISDEI